MVVENNVVNNVVDNKKFDLIIFDWDGTLIDSQANIVQCMQGMIADLDLPSRSPQQLSNIIGLGLQEALTNLFPDHQSDDFERMVDRYRYHFFASEPSQPFSGVEPVLQELVANDYLLAVATGKGRRGLDKALDHTGFRDLFHCTRCADETQSKPHPQMLHEILDVLGVDSHRAIMVGDTEWDLQMAKNAGMPALGVSYGVHHPDRLWECDPQAVIDEIGALLDWLDGEKIAKP